MLRIKDIEQALLHVVGWRQEKGYETGLEESLSGLYFQSSHPFVTLGNISSAMPEDAVLDEYVERLTLDAIDRVSYAFVQRKTSGGQSKQLLSRHALFDGAGNRKNVEESRSSIVGFEFVPLRHMGVTAKIERIGFQGYGTPGEIKLYVFHSSRQSPIREISVEVKGDGSFAWVDTESLYMPYENDYGDGGAWYICYDQKSMPLGLEAVNFGRDWSREPCGTCNRGNLQIWREQTKYLSISPFFAGGDVTEGLWDIEDNVYTPSTNYGINVEFSVHCDLSDFIISQKELFADVLMKQMAVDVVRLLSLNPEVRVNRRQLNVTRSDALYALDKTSDGSKGGLTYELEKAYKALDIDTSAMDSACLCSGRKGVRYGTV